MRGWIRLLLGLAGLLVADSEAAAASCRYRPGAPEAGLLMRATVLAPDKVLEHGEVRVDAGGTITCVGHCRAPGAAVLDCDGAVLSPGFINPHDHIAYAHVPPLPDRGERYAHRHEWRFGTHGHTRLETFGPTHDPRVVGWGELRFLAGGTTSIVGGAMAPGLARNLDFADGLEGLPIRPVTYTIFPLDDLHGIERIGDCDYGPHPTSRAEVAASSAFLAHVAEGRDAAAENEFRCESSTRFDPVRHPDGGGPSQDWLLPQATLIHAVGLSPADLALVAERHASLVWSPRSNLALYGATLDIATALRLGINVALGADWLPTGSMDMNRELACARAYSRTQLGRQISDRTLWLMATRNAARATRTEAWLGSIAPGHLADLVLFDRPAGQAAVTAAVLSTPRSTLLVLRGGRPLYGDAALLRKMRPGCAAVPVAGADKALCSEPGAEPPAALVAFAQEAGLYPLAFEGTPRDEPSCRVVGGR